MAAQTETAELSSALDLRQKDLSCRSLTLRASSVDEDSRSFEAVVATDTPARVFDMRAWEVIEEILIPRGGSFPERVPLLRNHQRSELDDVVGSAVDFEMREGKWHGRGIVARAVGEDDPVERYWRRIVDGHLRAVSIGYQVKEYTDIRAGDRQKVNGRDYQAGETTLRVTTAWQVHELSLTPIGADDRALIRNHQGGRQPEIRTYFR